MNVAFIPVRGGSKSIPLKNIKEICGKPLVYWTVKAACECEFIDKVFVSTDSEQIRNVVDSFKFEKVECIDRSPETACDTASTESAMIEFAERIDFDNIVLIQATSPMLTHDDLNNGFALFNSEKDLSVLSVVNTKRFMWEIGDDGFARPFNYDYMNRPRRQEYEGQYVENGAFYITSREKFMTSKNRISGKIKPCVMDEMSYYEIDEPSDWMIIEHLMKNREK